MNMNSSSNIIILALPRTINSINRLLECHYLYKLLVLIISISGIKIQVHHNMYGVSSTILDTSSIENRALPARAYSKSSKIYPVDVSYQVFNKTSQRRYDKIRAVVVVTINIELIQYSAV